jgi:hypothetical protein
MQKYIYITKTVNMNFAARREKSTSVSGNYILQSQYTPRMRFKLRGWSWRWGYAGPYRRHEG